MPSIDPQSWKPLLPDFKEKTASFYAGTLDKGAYKGFSGLYGSYAQKGGQSSMLRLRMTAGRVTRAKMAFVAEALRQYRVPRLHFTTCQSIQLHDLDGETAGILMERALDAGIVTFGGGGDFPRNVMCSPRSGVEEGEFFDVLPWAEAAADYLMGFIRAEKMPRKLKVAFSNAPQNVTHATYRDLGFAARADGTFDVYSAGGLGNHPLMGVKVAEGVAPEKILYYIKAMWLTFRAYGNYENRGKARTRYMQESLGGPENYRSAYLEKLEEALSSREDLTLSAPAREPEKAADGFAPVDPRVLPQKQPGLYTVVWHPLGGMPTPESFCALSDALQDMPGAEMRLSPDESAFFVNLTGREAQRILSLSQDGARTLFETSVSCIGGATCQVGVRDSQGLLHQCIQAVREAQLPDGALPQIHISGCPSSCGAHQTGTLGFRGGVKSVDGKLRPAFALFAGGEERQGAERMGRELGAIVEEDVPRFLVALGRAVAQSGLEFSVWRQAYPDALETLAAPYLA